jgi:uncharacterized membrane protein YqjE
MIGRLSPLARSRQLDPTQPTDPEREPTRDAKTPPPDPKRAPGLREQIGRMRAAVMGLVAAHVALAKAELGDILDEIKGVVVLSGVAIGALILAGLLFGVGLFLFLAEWLFGSIGWGVLHGPLFLTGVAVAAVLAALGYGGGRIGLNFGLAVLIGIVVGLALGLDLTNRGWSTLGNAIATNVPADIRPLVVAAATLAVLGGFLGLIGGARGGGIGGALVGLLVGAIAGALVGALTAVALGPRVGAAIGVTVALIAWPALMGMGVARTGIDTDKLKDRFYPKTTIDTTKETIEWVRKRTPLGPAS